MGAADVVPGVSGGTIAFIAGIYEELISSINKINLEALKVLRQDGVKAFWQHINGWFLLALVSGIGTSIISLAKLITHVLNTQPIATWSFFFGLVLASIPFVGKQVSKWDGKTIIGFIAGASIAYAVTILPASAETSSLVFIFFSAMLAICAMILPGISGSFILLLLGAYTTVLTGLKSFDLTLIAVFATGAVIGLLSFARLLKLMFAKHHNLTIAVLSGFLLGSLNKIWPWKQVSEVFVKHAGEADEKIVNIVETSVLPNNYTTPVVENGNVIDQLSTEPQLAAAIGFMILGIVIISSLEIIGRKTKK